VLSRQEQFRILSLWDRGCFNKSQIARAVGLPRCTVRDCILRFAGVAQWAEAADLKSAQWGFESLHQHQRRPYAYLLGMYLGDGYIATHPRTYRLRIFLNCNQPHIISECARAISVLAHPRKVSLTARKDNCIEVGCYWRSWPYVFPQHGPGKKHTRVIQLTDPQWDIVQEFPDAFVRGCIHSDGCKHQRIVRGKNYPAYAFSNRSGDIIDLFCQACDLLHVRHTRPNTRTVSIARRDAVALMDLFVGEDPDARQSRIMSSATPPTIAT
jgi:hypothetical protein